MSASRSYFVVIIGCGRMGSYLANRLSREGHSLVVVDIDSATFEALSAEFSGFQVEGDATEFAVLKQAKVDKADLVIAATEEDNVNLMVAQIAKKIFNVSRVMARVFDPKRAEVYRDFGIQGICPTVMAGDALLDLFQHIPINAGGDQR